jgi:hypothetical protein
MWQLRGNRFGNVAGDARINRGRGLDAHSVADIEY